MEFFGLRVGGPIRRDLAAISISIPLLSFHNPALPCWLWFVELYRYRAESDCRHSFFRISHRSGSQAHTILDLFWLVSLQFVYQREGRLRHSRRVALPIVILFAFAMLFGPVLAFSQVAQPTNQPGAPTLSAPAVTQNTVTTTGPVTSETTISAGTLAGQALTWAVTGFGSVLATIFAAWGIRLFKLAGVQVTDAFRDRLQQIILNGLNIGAKAVAQNLDGKAKIDVKNAVIAQAVQYTQDHGADTIKALGLDPKSGAAVEAIKARIETAIADPMAPTPAVLEPINPRTAA